MARIEAICTAKTNQACASWNSTRVVAMAMLVRDMAPESRQMRDSMRVIRRFSAKGSGFVLGRFPCV